MLTDFQNSFTDGLDSKFAIKSFIKYPHNILNMLLRYLVKYRCPKNCRAQEMSEENCHARLRHSNSCRQSSSTVMLPLFNSLTKRILSGHTENPIECTDLLLHRQKMFGKIYETLFHQTLVAHDNKNAFAYESLSVNESKVFYTSDWYLLILKVRINGLHNETTVNNIFASHTRSTASSSFLSTTVPVTSPNVDAF